MQATIRFIKRTKTLENYLKKRIAFLALHLLYFALIARWRASLNEKGC